VHEKVRDPASAFVRKQIGRRELLKRSSQLGLEPPPPDDRLL